MSNVYLLFYDHDWGDRENWNTFYTPCEVFSTAEARDERVEFLKTKDEGLEYYFINTNLDPKIDSKVQNDGNGGVFAGEEDDDV